MDPIKPYNAVTGLAWFPDALTLSLVAVTVLAMLAVAAVLVFEWRDRAAERRRAVLANLDRPARVRSVAL